jgi:cell division protein ZapA
MSDRKNSVKVTILDEEYSIRSSATPEHTKAVAEHVDRAIRQIMQSGHVVDTQRAAILAALQITGEMFDAREASYSVAGDMRRLADEIRPWLPPSKRHD